MRKHDEISSTEKLLDLIRGKRNPETKPVRTARPKSPGAPHLSLRKLLSFRKSVVIGADIGNEDLKLLKVRQVSDQKPELLDYRIIPLDARVSSDTHQLSNLMQAELKRFCGTAKKNVRIWSVLSVPGFQPRYLRIPKVPKRQLPNAVYWAYKKDIPFEDKDMIFDFQVLGDLDENNVRRTEVIAYAVPRADTEQLKSLFARIGFPLKGISAYPFFFQNLFRTQCAHTTCHHTCNLYVGKTGSRIDIFSPRGHLILSRKIRAGMDSMIGAIKDRMDEKLGGRAGDTAIYNVDPYEIAEKMVSDRSEQAQQMLFSLFSDVPLSEKRGTFSEAEIFQMILPALERLARQLEITFEHYAANFYREPVKRLYISGEIGNCPRFTNYIGNQLSIPTDAIDPFDPETSVFSPPRPEKVPPEKKHERLGFAPAAGMILSDDTLTPNFIFTHREKKKSARIGRIYRAIYAGLFLIAMMCGGVYYYQGNMLVEKRATLMQLHREMTKYTPPVNRNLILQKVAKIKRTKKRLKAYGEKYLSVAALSDLSALTHANVRLTHVTIELGKLGGTEETVTRTMTLEGIILGEPMTFESTLAGYLAGLKKSPLFRNPAIRTSTVVFFQEQKALRFDVALELI